MAGDIDCLVEIPHKRVGKKKKKKSQASSGRGMGRKGSEVHEFIINNWQDLYGYPVAFSQIQPL